ncbi:efflux RND transporter periplasmic adaptor subunit [Thiohalospira sp.]|uniref:efflux RND transporter periplasmic adaptor subunit n=1 Tax=Thiohalospira sp. TaxID=3080549 RepID=UPI00397F499B
MKSLLRRRTWRRALKWALVGLVPVLLVLGVSYLLLRPAPVSVATAQPGELHPTLEVPGTVEARREFTVGARIASEVEEIHVDQRDRVEEGQLLAVLEDRELREGVAQAEQALVSARNQAVAARSTVERVRAELGKARRDYRRNQASEDYLADKELDASETALRTARAALEGAQADLAAREAEVARAEAALEEARTRRGYARVTAKRPGLVIEREVESGEAVQPGTPLLRLIDPSTLWVNARVDETVVGRVEEGQPARIRLRSGPELAGEVARVEPLSDPATRELAVDIAFQEPPERIILNEEARVTIRTGTVSGLVVPASAVVYRQGEARVFTLVDGRARPRPVELAATEGDQALVREGLEAGARVITAPGSVADGDRVTPRSGEGG